MKTGRGSMTFRDERSLPARNEFSALEWSQRQGIGIITLAAVLVFGAFLSGAAAKDRQPTTRIVSGTVYDNAGNPIIGATVELTDLQTGKVLDIYSQENGDYQYSGLRFDHDYTIKAIYKTTSSEVRKISMFETRWHLVMNLTIPKPAK